MMVPSCPPGLFTKQFTEQAEHREVPEPSGPAAMASRFHRPTRGTIRSGRQAGTPSLTASTGSWTTSPWPSGLLTATSWTTEYKDLWVSGIAPVQIAPHYFPYLNDEFFYSGVAEPPPPAGGVNSTDATQGWPGPLDATGKRIVPNPVSPSNGNYIGGPGGAGWYKMLEFFEVPSPAFGTIGEVAQGANYDWLRQDLKPGQLNLNLIIDEEVFLALMGQDIYTALNQKQIQFPNLLSYNTFGNTTGFVLAPLPPLGGSFTPVVATQAGVTPANPSIPQVGIYPNGFYSMPNVGWLDGDDSGGVNPNGAVIQVFNNMKGAFSDFLKLRHGGSGYMFAFGNGMPTGQYANGVTGQYGGVDANGNPIAIAPDRPFRSLSYPDINFTILRPADLPPSAFIDPNPIFYFDATGTVQQEPNNPNNSRDRQLPPGNDDDLRCRHVSRVPGVQHQRTPSGNLRPTPQSAINIYDQINNTGNPATDYTQDPGMKTPYLFTANNPVQPPPIPATRLFQVPDNTIPGKAAKPGDPPQTYSNASNAGDSNVNHQTIPINLNHLPLPITATTAHGADLTNPKPNDNLGYVNPTAGAPLDHRDHPYFRTEWLQRMANLTTVRTHQYAVWITVGFFEVTTVGDSSLAVTVPTKAYDIMGTELGLLDGKNKRYRSFFLIDRTRATGFNPSVPGDFRDCVVYRQDIEA